MVRLLKPDRPKVRDYSSRREQFRLLFLIVPLGIVIVLMTRLRDPETAKRINRFFAPASSEPTPVPSAAGTKEPKYGGTIGDVAAAESVRDFPGVLSREACNGEWLGTAG